MIPLLLRSIALRWFVLATLFLSVCTPVFAARRTGRARPAAAAEAIQYQALPLERSRQNHLLVRAFINGKPALLGVDTGAPVSAVALHRRNHYRISPVPGRSKLPGRLLINGAYNRVGIAKTLQLGGLTLVDEPLVAIDLSNSTKAARLLREEAIDGILGADILFPTKAVIDCQKQLLVMKMDPNTPGNIPGFDYRSHRAIPMHVSKGWNLYVDGTVNGRKAKLLVDTGAFSTLMHRNFIRRLRIPVRKTNYSSAGVNLRRRDVQAATIQRLSIGQLDLVRKDVGVMDLAGLIHGGMLEGKPPVAGLLGSEILWKHHGIIDFGTQMLYLKR